MTGSAIFGRRLIEEHRLASDNLGDLMTVATPYSLMCAAQRKRRAGLMIKKRRLPLHAVVAVGATRDIAFSKLFFVDIFVAVFALCGRSLEVHIQQFGFEIGWLVAADARRSAMCSEQGKLCF